jgi:hypothetical protein
MLLLECKPDEVLAHTLGVARRDCLHHNDKGRVCNALQKRQGCVAMIDEDPSSAQPPYLATLVIESDQHGLRVFRDPARQHRVVIVRPRLEEWLIATAQHAQVQVADFGFSERGNAMHRDINSKLPKLEELIEALLCTRSVRLLHLQRLIA